MRSPSAASRAPRSRGHHSSPPPSSALAPPPRVEFEVEPRVRHIEQQLQEQLPPKWREFAGRPQELHYYGQRINTYRENPELRPSEAYVRWAVRRLRATLEARDAKFFTDQELREIVFQEWRTDMTRSVWEARLNRHGSRDGPVVRRSPSGVIYVSNQPRGAAAAAAFVKDGLAPRPTSKGA